MMTEYKVNIIADTRMVISKLLNNRYFYLAKDVLNVLCYV